MKNDLARLRRRIDELDERIVRLLNQRLAIVSVIGRLKIQRGLGSYSARRTQEILRNVAAANQGPHTDTQLRKIYRAIVAASVELQERQGRSRRS